jgi:hypothetical protein
MTKRKDSGVGGNYPESEILRINPIAPEIA